MVIPNGHRWKCSLTPVRFGERSRFCAVTYTQLKRDPLGVLPCMCALLLVLLCSSTRRYASGRFLELLLYSFNPANEDVTMELFDAGMESGLWLSDAAGPRS